MDERSTEPLLATLRDLVAWLRAESVPGVVIGGVAASALGRARSTQDVDALVSLDEARWAAFLASGEEFGFSPRQSGCLDFARTARVLLLRHAPTAVQAEVVFAGLPFECEVIERAVWTDIGGVEAPIPTPEDLIIMKSVAHRPRDLGDVEGIVEVQSDLDWQRIMHWAQAFVERLDRSEIMTHLQGLRDRVEKQ